MRTQRWLLGLAVAQATLFATLVLLADTDRLTPLLVAVHAVPCGDKLGHLVLTGALALTLDLALGARTWTVARVPLRIGSMAVLAAAVLEEITQLWLPSRRFDVGDLAADVVGIALGGVLASFLVRCRASRLARADAWRTARIVICGVSLVALVAACDRADVVEPSLPQDPPPAPPAPAVPETDDDPRARAIREAEAFVRAQGYTEAAPTVSGDDVVREGIEGTLEDRRDTLDPTAVSATGEGEQWSVVFRYRDPQYTGRARELQIHFGEVPRFVHQDRVLDFVPPAPSE